MPFFLLFAVAATIVAGHFSLWLSLFNYLHAQRISCRWLHWSERLIALILTVPVLAFAWRLLTREFDGASIIQQWTLAGVAYGGVCCGSALMALIAWLRRKRHRDASAGLLSNHTHNTRIDERIGESPVAGRGSRWLAALPGNQIFDLHIHTKQIALPKLAPPLQGLKIVHLTDLHMSGRMTKPFYREIVEQANELQGDLTIISGDIIENPRCLDWLDLLGRLRSPLGVFFILGNHDLRMPDIGQVRRRLERCGLRNLGGADGSVVANGATIWLAGNERPWFSEIGRSPPDAPPVDLSIAVCHAPDQFPWACREGFDLVLAGHTHGGQVRLPMIGPLVCPSAFGLRYAAGLFRSGSTVMHVSRGVSALHPLRINCPPELSMLVLQKQS